MMKHFYVGVKGVICIDNKVLLLKGADESGGTYWDMPGGRIDDAETIQEALQRELQEELPSLRQFSQGKIVTASRHYKDLKDGLGLLFLFYRIDAEPFEVVLSSEHLEYRWVGKDDIDSLINDTSTFLSPSYLEVLTVALDKH